MCSAGSEVIDGDGVIHGHDSNDDSETPIVMDIRFDKSRASKVMAIMVQPGICTSSVMCRKEVLQKTGLFDPMLLWCQDTDMWIKVLMSYKVARIPRALTQYRVHSGN